MSTLEVLKKMFMQEDGVITSGSAIQVSTATVRGVKSFGMICSAFDLGWMEEANGFAVELPLESEPGEALEAHPPKVLLLHACRKSVHKMHDPPLRQMQSLPYMHGHFWHMYAQGAILSEEDAAGVKNKEKASEGKKGKSKSKKDFANAFDALGLEDEPESAPEAPEPAGGMANGVHPGDAEPSSNGTAAEEDEDALDLMPKQKKGKKKKKGVDIAGAFAALAVEDGGEDGGEGRAVDNGTTAPPADDGEPARERGVEASTSQAEVDDELILPGAKKGNCLLLMPGNAHLDPVYSDGQDVAIYTRLCNANSKESFSICAGKKKKEKQEGDADIDALLAAMHEESTSQPQARADGEDAELVSGAKKKKKKKGKDGENIDFLLASINGDAPAAAQETAGDAAAQDAVATPSAPETSGVAGEGGVAAEPESTTQSKKGKKKGKKVRWPYSDPFLKCR